MSFNYSEIKINGMHYVREVKDEKGERGFYLLIDNYNKPVHDVYNYVKERMKRYGDTLNAIKRKVYDLCHLYNFMSIHNISVEILTYEHVYNFTREYLRQINPEFRVNDCIERSMLNKLPILEEFENKNIKILYNYRTRALDSDSIARILDNCKNFLVYLKYTCYKDINLDRIFPVKDIVIDTDSKMLGHLMGKTRKVYTTKGILKAADVSYVKGIKCKPIDVNCVFEKDEEDRFFQELNNIKNPSIKLFFYLINKTGIRVNEGLALKVEEYDIKKGDEWFNGEYSDVMLKNKEENLWEVRIIYRPDNPKDLQLKYHKERTIPFIDSGKVFYDLYKQAILYRTIKMKSKRKNHNFLFINRSGNRLKYPRTYQIFGEILHRSELSDRKGQLVIHSFRHTYASRWIQKIKHNNIDIELNELSKILGHATSKTTKETYLHFFKEDILDLLKKMDNSKYQLGV